MPKLLDGCGTLDRVGDEKVIRPQFEAALVGEAVRDEFRFQRVFTPVNDTHRGFIDPSERSGGGGLVEASGPNCIVGGARTKAVASRGITQVAEGSGINQKLFLADTQHQT